MTPFRLLLLATCFAACGGPKDADVTAQTTGDTSEPTDRSTPTIRGSAFDAAAKALQGDIADSLASGASVAVSVGGEAVWVEAFGSTDPDDDVPMTPDTLLQIGSTTKQMTAAQALVQVDAGRLTLQDTVASRLPDVSLQVDPSWAKTATLHQLLSHQGGPVDFIDWAGGPEDDELASWHEGFFSSQMFPMSPPGAFWNYSNPNFTVAGLMAQSVDPDGAVWADAMTRDLFAPLGMQRTYARKADVRSDGDFSLSTGTDPLGGPMARIPMPQVPDPASARPAGLVWSTPSEMLLWGQFLLEGDTEVLADPLREAITTPQVPTQLADDVIGYGYGVFTYAQYPIGSEWYPIEVRDHGGNTLSFTSSLVLVPEHDLVISILSNGFGDDHADTVDAILRAVIDPLPAPTGFEPSFDVDAIADHIGAYVTPHNGVGPVEVTKGGKYGLQIAMPNLTGHGYTVDPDLIPISTDVWLVLLNDEPYDLTFIRPEIGAPPQFIRNRTFVVVRAGDEAVSAVRPPMPSPSLGPMMPTLPMAARNALWKAPL